MENNTINTRFQEAAMEALEDGMESWNAIVLLEQSQEI